MQKFNVKYRTTSCVKTINSSTRKCKTVTTDFNVKDSQ